MTTYNSTETIKGNDDIQNPVDNKTETKEDGEYIWGQKPSTIQQWIWHSAITGKQELHYVKWINADHCYTSRPTAADVHYGPVLITVDRADVHICRRYCTLLGGTIQIVSM